MTGAAASDWLVQWREPMKRTLVFLVLIGVALTGCSAGAGSEKSAQTKPSAASDDGKSDETEPVEAEPADEPAAEPAKTDGCLGISPDALTQLVGSDLGEAQKGSTNVTVNEIKWTADRCEWGDRDTLEVIVSSADKAAFPDSAVFCELSGLDPEPVSGIGEAASWDFMEINGASGKLVVCTQDRWVSIRMRAPTADTAAFRDQSIELARLALAA